MKKSLKKKTFLPNLEKAEAGPHPVGHEDILGVHGAEGAGGIRHSVKATELNHHGLGHAAGSAQPVHRFSGEQHAINQ